MCLAVFQPAAAASGFASGDVRVVPIHDPALDFAVRLNLIRSATRSIDIAMYHLGADDRVGRPLLEALRDASERGVKVRVITSYFASFHAKSLKLAPLLINDDHLKSRGELVTFGRWFSTPIKSPNAKFWTTFDEKLYVIDGHTAVIGGRGQDGEYLAWQDAHFLVQGSVVAELGQVFERSWKQAVRYFGKTRKDRWKQNHPERVRAFPRSALLENRQAEASRLIQGTEGYRPESVRVLHHHLIGLLDANPRKRFEPMPDPVLDAFIAHSRTSKRILYYSLYPAQDERLARALAAARKRGARVEVITNSLRSSKTLDSSPWPYHSGIRSQLATARLGAAVRQWQVSPGHVFMHQKAAIFDDTVLVGSHNFNWSSTNSYDQLNLEIRDRALADEMAADFDSLAARHTRRMTVKELAEQEVRYAVGILLSDWFFGFY